LSRKLEVEKSLVESISPDISSNTIELTEVAVDSILDDGLLRDIPIINTLVGIFKVGKTITQRYYIKKIINFLNTFNSIDKESRKRFIEDELSTDKDKEKFGETILLLIEKADEIEKTILYAKVFKMHIEHEDFCSYSEAIRICKMIDKSFYNDLCYLVEFKNGDLTNQHITDELYKNGFLSFGGINGGTFGGHIKDGGVMYNINKYGEILKKILSETR